MYAVGLMSGTSLDGIDAALVEIEGIDVQTKVKLLKFITLPFSEETLVRLKRAFSVPNSNVELICSLNVELGYLSSLAVKEVCHSASFDYLNLDFVASHGQTVYHLPNPEIIGLFPSSLQIGEPAVICEEVKTTIVSNFRARDLAVGGQGAPIVPYSEFVLYRSEEKHRLLQNIGGIGNVTYLPRNAEIEQLIAFDTGPGNMIIDELCRYFYQKEYDRAGIWAKQGLVQEELLAELMNHPYISLPYPKTTGRELFGEQFVKELLSNWTFSANDWIATATMFTALSIAQNIKTFIVPGETELIIGGGGSYNQTLVEMLKNALPEVDVLIQEDCGFSSEAKEAVAMVVLGNQTLGQKSSNVPSATGAKRAVPLGSVTYF